MEFYKSSFLRIADVLGSVGYRIDYDDCKRKDDKFFIVVYVNTCQDVPSFQSWKEAYTWICGFKSCVKCHPVIF